MKDHILFWTITIITLLCCTKGFSQSKSTYTRITGEFYINVADILKDMDDKTFSDLLTNVETLSSYSTKINAGRLSEEKTDTPVESIEIEAKEISKGEWAKVRYVKFDIALTKDKDEKDISIDEILKNIITLRAYAISENLDYGIVNKAKYHECSHEEGKSCEGEIEIK